MKIYRYLESKSMWNKTDAGGKISPWRKGFQLMAEPLQKEAMYKPTRFNGSLIPGPAQNPSLRPGPLLDQNTQICLLWKHSKC